MDSNETAARLEIAQVLYRYCRGLDRGDVVLLQSVYHPDATDNRGDFVGSGHDFARVFIERRDRTGSISQHHVTNSLVDIDGNQARVESYFIAYSPGTDLKTNQPVISHITGRYLDRFEKRNGEWKIADRKVVVDWAEQWTPREWPNKGRFLAGGRREADPSHAFFVS